MDEFDASSEEFDAACSEFVTPDDLLNRLLLIIPLRRDEKKNSKGEEYSAIFCDVVVLSGNTTDKIQAVPVILDDVMISASRCVAQLASRLPSARNGYKGRMYLGRMNGRPSTRNRNVTAYGFGEPDQDGDIQKGRVGVALYKANQEQVKESDPFA